LKYTENHREALKRFTEAGELEKYLDKQNLLDQFTNYVQMNGTQAVQTTTIRINPDRSQIPGIIEIPAVEPAQGAGVKADPEGLRISGKIIHTQIKAYIARNILDNKGFYPIWEQIDTTLKYAIKYLEK
jgi:carboxyl-terminal processing protease